MRRRFRTMIIVGGETGVKGHIRQRGPKTWALVIELGRDADGKRRQKWITVHGGKRDAQRELARVLTELNAGGVVEPARITLARYLEKWLEAVKPNLAPKTFDAYQEAVDLHLKPRLGHLQLTQLQPLHIQNYYSHALEHGRRDGKGGLSPRTVLHHHRILRQALAQAVKWQLLIRNPADAVEAPRPTHREMTALNAAETAQLLEAARGTRLYLPVLLAITTGMRRGEILGLRWSDVDLKEGTVQIRQALLRTRDGSVLGTPKTHRSRRGLVLPELAVEALRQQQRAQAALREQFGPDYQEHGLVCTQEDGQPLDPHQVSKSFQRLVARLPIPTVRFHDLRHSHATHLLLQGVHPKVVSERLGHSTISITLDTYSHVLPGMQQDAAQKVDQALRQALRSREMMGDARGDLQTRLQTNCGD